MKPSANLPFRGKKAIDTRALNIIFAIIICGITITLFHLWMADAYIDEAHQESTSATTSAVIVDELLFAYVNEHYKAIQSASPADANTLRQSLMSHFRKNGMLFALGGTRTTTERALSVTYRDGTPPTWHAVGTFQYNPVAPPPGGRYYHTTGASLPDEINVQSYHRYHYLPAQNGPLILHTDFSSIEP